MSSLTPGRPGAVVASFRPDDALLRLVTILVVDCDVLVIDDGSGAGEWDGVYRAVDDTGAGVVRRASNDGIAAALNTGAQTLFDAGAPVVFTFDQDSTPPPDFVARMTAAARAARDLGRRVAALVPETFAEVRQARGPEVGPGLWAARSVIQSGMLIPRDAWDGLGPMRDDFFIDLVDTEFELRALVRGWQVLAVRGVSMPHSLGRRVRLQLLPGVRLTTSVSTPFRFYYRARNRILLTRMYIRRKPARILAGAAIDFVFFVVAVLGARPRRALFGILARGAADGLRGRRGRMPTRVAEIGRSVSWSGEAFAEGKGR